MEAKILGISSGRTMGNAEIMLRECLMECEKKQACDVRIVRLRQLKIHEFEGDFSFLEELENGGDGKDSFQDDLEWLKEQILWADAIVFSSPDFTYMPTSEVINLLNRGLGVGQEYRNACRRKPKKIGLMAVGGSDTVDFHLPLLNATIQAICPGAEIVDQFYADWLRGKGYVAFQENLLEQARQMAVRLVNSLNGYAVPAIKTYITKLNPLEYSEESRVYLEGCPVCHSPIVTMKNDAFSCGKFKCTICGATGKVANYGKDLVYEWDDESIAHNRLHEEHEKEYAELYKREHQPVKTDKEQVAEFPRLTPSQDATFDKPYIMAVVAGPKEGTSELLARKALEQATQNGKYQGVLINVLDLNIRICSGCLVCKVNSRYRGGIDECIIKDDDMWLVDKFMDAAGVILSVDDVNGFTYARLCSFWQRFGHFTKTKGKIRVPAPNAFMISSMDDQVENSTFGLRHISNFFCKFGPKVAEELFTYVPLDGDNILADHASLERAGMLGSMVGSAVNKITLNPSNVSLIRRKEGVCPCCGLNLIELHSDMTVSCPLCDSKGRFETVFGENDIVWDEYSVKHSRFTQFGAMLHFKHIDFSQEEDKDVLENPNIIEEKLNPYKEYGKVVKPIK